MIDKINAIVKVNKTIIEYLLNFALLGKGKRNVLCPRPSVCDRVSALVAFVHCCTDPDATLGNGTLQLGSKIIYNILIVPKFTLPGYLWY